jgi:alanyl aminopeptidase
MAHELAHSWFGNLVTMSWWDDVWLNEAFATWIAHRVVEEVHPEYQSDIALLQRVHSAMEWDSLASARRIRQPIATNHDIANAFDPITYSKGAGVLSMFDRWLGEETFRSAIRGYMAEHHFDSAEAGDLMRSLSSASDRDVTGPFESFLTQPGVPFLHTKLMCDEGGSRLSIEQSRYRQAGSTFETDAVWEIPVCARYGVAGGVRERCDLVGERRTALPLEPDVCPDWVLPNAAGAGYYRWADDPRDNESLRTRGWKALTTRERLAVADSLSASFYAGAIGPESVLPTTVPLARDENRAVAETPMILLQYIIDNVVDESELPAARSFAASLYEARMSELGFEASPSEDGERRLLRNAVLRFLALQAHDPVIRNELARRGRAYAGADGPADLDAVGPDLTTTALVIAVQDGDSAIFDTLLERLGDTSDSVERWRILEALGASLDPERAKRARDLALDPELRMNEVLITLDTQMQYPRMRNETWTWITEHYQELAERVGRLSESNLPWLAWRFCDDARADEVQQFFAPFIDEVEGGPRNLAGAVEDIRICAALARTQGPATTAYFSNR